MEEFNYNCIIAIIDSKITIRNAQLTEFKTIGKIMVTAYSQLVGFPKESEQPAYYKMLLNVGNLTKKENTELLVATLNNEVAGAVVYFSDMKNYGAGGTASSKINASGFRLLAVDPKARGNGIGKLLCIECINRARKLNHKKLFIHSTKSMQVAWGMYEKLGFKRCEDIDFNQGELQVFGFELEL